LDFGGRDLNHGMVIVQVCGESVSAGLELAEVATFQLGDNLAFVGDLCMEGLARYALRIKLIR
tara:strand:+ start:1423 stop:1611 length:189 start_codon:yes stop_codon:yes gene_type:complete